MGRGITFRRELREHSNRFELDRERRLQYQSLVQRALHNSKCICTVNIAHVNRTLTRVRVHASSRAQSGRVPCNMAHQHVVDEQRMHPKHEKGLLQQLAIDRCLTIVGQLLAEL
eukprot:COSAG05_NODE_104_length_18950_cov_118.655403_2_plen_114_part_00